MTLAVDLGGLCIEAARLVNEDVNPAGRLDQPARRASVAAVGKPSTVPPDHTSHRAAARGLVINQKHRQTSAPPELH